MTFKLLIDMELPSFAAFLNRCFFKTLSLSVVQKRKWKHQAMEWVGDTQTSLITEDQLEKRLGHEVGRDSQDEKKSKDKVTL